MILRKHLRFVIFNYTDFSRFVIFIFLSLNNEKNIENKLQYDFVAFLHRFSMFLMN